MVKTKIVDSDYLQSYVISFLRFPLIVGVVLIHTQITTINGIIGDYHKPLIFDGYFPLYESIYCLFSEILARVAVPLFFFFSGFLFFFNSHNNFTIETYVQKLKKRSRTLLVPYIFWNILFVVVYNGVGKLFPGATESFIGNGYTVKDWLMTLFDYANSGYPVSGQFWFIRDLIIVVLFTPFIWVLTKYLNYILPVVLCSLWLIGCWFNNLVISLDAIFFFTLGAYFSITEKNFVNLIKSRAMLLGILYLISVVIIFYTKSFDWVIYVRKVNILLGGAFTIALSSICIESGKWKLKPFLTESSFFIYAYHIIALPIIRRVLFYIIPCSTDVRATILYFLWAFITIVIGLLLYYSLKKWMPKTTAFITGGR